MNVVFSNVDASIVFRESEFVTASIIGDMAVLKLTSMGSKERDFENVAKAYIELVKRARKEGVKRILIDLISNGGGLVVLSDFLQSLITKQYDPKELCLHYNKRVSRYWMKWVKSFGRGLQESTREYLKVLADLGKSMPLEVVRWYAKWQFMYLRGVLSASNEILGDAFGCVQTPLACDGLVTIKLSKVDACIDQVMKAATMEDILGVTERALESRSLIPNILLGSGDAGEAQGWYPFTGQEILDKATLKQFPHMKEYLDPETQQWGGRESNYSKRGIFQTCLFAAPTQSGLAWMVHEGFLTQDTAENVALHRDHPFEDIAVVTDGLAGSAASALPSKLMASGYSTLFTYGGRGDPDGIDTSGFAGGNVLEYEKWWPKVATAAELGMWLLPGSAWETYSQSINNAHDSLTPVYPYPMPLDAAVGTFNFNMMYVPEFSDDTSLPRQFYRLPAHKHYDEWPKELGSTCENVKELVGLYKKIHDEDWWAVRSDPIHLGKGWSSSCLPPATQRCCCNNATCSKPSPRVWPIDDVYSMPEPGACDADSGCYR